MGKRYLVVRSERPKGKPYAQPRLFAEIVSAPSKKALRRYFLDWDSDTPNTVYNTLSMKRWKKED